MEDSSNNLTIPINTSTKKYTCVSAMIRSLMIGQNELPKLNGLIVRASRAREDFADRRVEVSENYF